MRRAGWSLVLVLGACGTSGGAAPPAAQEPTAAAPPGATAAAPAPAPKQPYLDRLPPLIEREVLFGDPEIAGGQLSPDGKYVTFRKQNKGVMNIWIKKIDEPFEAARPLTADTARPVRGYFWSQDSRYIIYGQDKGGDENFHVYLVDPRVPPDQATGVPPARDLTPYDGVRASIYDVPENTPGKILVGLNDRDARFHDVYWIELKSGKRTLLRQNDENVAGWVADRQGNLRLAIRVDDQGGTEILRVDGKKLVPIYTCTALESCGPVRFHKDNRRVYFRTNKGEDDLIKLVLLDPRTSKEEPVESDPDKKVDFGGAAFYDKTEELAFTYYEDDRLRVYPRTEQAKKDWEIVRKALPDGDLYFGSGTEDDRLRLVSVTSDVDPGATYLYDRRAGKVTFLYRPQPKLPTAHLAPMKPIRYQARDGLEIPGYLTLPKGVEPKNLPAIVLPHGGPWGRDSWGYHPTAQFYANRGYAVLQPNFRASTGYGKKFLNLGNKQWGTGTMQHDISDGVAWLIKEGIADPKRVAITGGSYGGFATLAGLAFTPDLYCAGVDIVGPSSIITLLNTIPPYWAPIKKMFHVRVGDPQAPEDQARLRAQSPLHFAKNIRAPLMIIQGANDPRVKQSESDQIVIALRELNRPVEYLVAPDEGHGFAGQNNRLAMYAAIEKFFVKHLGGRAQESLTPEAAQKLAAMTVDPKTVKLVARPTLTGKTPARFVGDVGMPPIARYAEKVETGGKKMEARSTVTVEAGTEQDRPVWVVMQKVEGATGNGSDRTVLDRQTLLPLKRSIDRGPAKIELVFEKAGVKGNMNMGGREVPIDAKIGDNVVADGTPLFLALRTLPLEKGYSGTVRSFDVRTGQPKDYLIEAKAAEPIQVPAGKFVAYRVELVPSDGGGRATVWIEKASPRRLVKSHAVLPPQMGGGTFTTELQ